eukprot:Lankesteria_metandrocarpae@DN845_c0_g1_i2.p1
MDTLWQRTNSVFCSFIGALFLACAFNFLPSAILRPVPKIQPVIEVTKIYDFIVNQRYQAEQSNVALKMDANFADLFQWNGRELFLYVKASYESKNNPRNEVCIWDEIVLSSEKAVINSSHEYKYPLRDDADGLKGVETTLTLVFQYIPVVGVLYEKEVATTKFMMPEKYYLQSAKENAMDESTDDSEDDSEDGDYDDWEGSEDDA